MDVWVAVAAAGAGYLAKYFQNVLKERDGLCDGSLFSEHSESKTSMSAQPVNQLEVECGKPDSFNQSFFLHNQMKRPIGNENSSGVEDLSSGLDKRLADTLRLDVPGSSACEVASTSEVDGVTLSNSEKRKEKNVFFFSSSRRPFFWKCDHQDGGDVINNVSDYEQNYQDYFLQPNVKHQRIDNDHVFRRGRNACLSKWSCGYSVKPQTSLESCLVAQLGMGHFEMEEYVLGPFPSPSMPNMRQLVITNGNQIISKANCDFLHGQFESEEHMYCSQSREGLRANETRNSTLPLPHLGLTKLSRKLKKGTVITPSTRRSSKVFQSQGLHEEILLFCFGLSIGVMSTILSSKRVVDKLNNLLKQSQNLVQDLHEELEMKDSVTVQELSNEPCVFQEINDTGEMKESLDPLPHPHQTGDSPNSVANKSTLFEDKEAYAQGDRDKSELMSRIEAELEAELERLELNINTSSLERRLSELGELDPDIVAEVVHGDLRPEMIDGGAAISDDDTGGNSTSETHPANYAVSPRELSLRLHEVIQSRLEERISELELALQESQKRLYFMEGQRDFSNSDFGSASTHESPTRMENGHPMSSPLYLNLEGDALNAYNEAYAEFLKEENLPSTVTGTEQTDDRTSLFSQTPYRDWIANENGYLSNLDTDKIKSNGTDERMHDNYEDELGMLLIKQLVEKTRQGSPVVLNAQRMLFTINDD